jgi:hypothetical protein
VVAEGAAPEEEVEGLLAVPCHFYSAAWIQLPQRTERELDLEGTILDQQDIGAGLGSG